VRVVLGITGGIAAYKATAIIRLLTEAGHSVKVVPTQNALRFIGSATLEALSHNTVDPDLYTDVADVKHIELGKNADLVIVAPATASFIARFAAGIADDLLGNVLLATPAPIVIAPAMHTEMWQNPATVANIETLRGRGITVIEPASGRLTGEDNGVGRLPEPADIVSAALSVFPNTDLEGVRICVTAGGTQEPIDPVRFIGNRSSGKQGIAIAQEAKRRGAQVTLLAANIETTPGDFENVVHVQTAAELESAVSAQLGSTDVLVMAAAVSDFRVTNASNSKIKRSEVGETLTLQLVANSDILRDSVARISAEGLSVVTVAFAAETTSDENLLAQLAQKKFDDKGCDVLVANDVSGGSVFGADSNKVLILNSDGKAVAREGSKHVVANAILDVVQSELVKKKH
jgi:phosphopantothenoylcysteine decarboxylase/phosphopantothenate--cysteine ligase